MADFIKKLQSIDVKDLKNLDYQKILQDVKKRPDIIISSAVVVMALLISINLVSSHFRESQSLRNDIATLERKLSVVEDYKKVRDEMDAFMAQIPAPMAEQDLINILTDIAVKRRVQIESYTPGRKQGEKLYDLVSIQMNISAREYSDLWLFIYDIEQSELPMRIENWTGSLKSAMGETGSGQSGGAGIFVTLEVAAINIKK